MSKHLVKELHENIFYISLPRMIVVEKDFYIPKHNLNEVMLSVPPKKHLDWKLCYYSSSDPRYIVIPAS